MGIIKYPFTTNMYLLEAARLAELLNTTFEVRNYGDYGRRWSAEFIGYGAWSDSSAYRSIKLAIKCLKEDIEKEAIETIKRKKS
jgi:hypothetical protein